MKKNTLFLSAGITTFILLLLAGLIMKVRTGSMAAPVAAQAPTVVPTQVPTETLQPTFTATITTQPTVPSVISPQEAVFIAARALGNTQVYSVDSETRYGLDVYKVTFSSGHIVFISPRGVILSIDSPHATVIQPAVDQSSDNSLSGSQGNVNSAPPSESDDGGETDDH